MESVPNYDAIGKFSANGRTRVFLKISLVQRNTRVEIRKYKLVLYGGVIWHVEIYWCIVHDKQALQTVALKMSNLIL